MKKAFLVVLLIACLAIAGWNGYLLFAGQIDPIAGWILLAVSIGVVLWNTSVLRRAFRIRTQTVFAVLVVTALAPGTVAAFEGIEPFAGIKDSAVSGISDVLAVSEDAAARRTVRATIGAFNQGRGDRLANLTTSDVRDELMLMYFGGTLLGGVRIIDYKLSTVRSGEDASGSWSEVRVRGGLSTVFGVDVYDAVFFVRRIGNDWIVTSISS